MTALKVNKRNSIGKRHSKKFIHKLNNEDDIKLFLQTCFYERKTIINEDISSTGNSV